MYASQHRDWPLQAQPKVRFENFSQLKQLYLSCLGELARLRTDRSRHVARWLRRKCYSRARASTDAFRDSAVHFFHSADVEQYSVYVAMIATMLSLQVRCTEPTSKSCTVRTNRIRLQAGPRPFLNEKTPQAVTNTSTRSAIALTGVYLFYC